MDDPAQQLATNAIRQLATNAIRQTLLDNRGVAFCRSCLVKLVRHNNVWAKQHVQNAVQAFFQDPGLFLKKNECSQCRIVGINRALTAPPESG
jgi:hypothetical protein